PSAWLRFRGGSSRFPVGWPSFSFLLLPCSHVLYRATLRTLMVQPFDLRHLHRGRRLDAERPHGSPGTPDRSPGVAPAHDVVAAGLEGEVDPVGKARSHRCLRS